MNTEGHCDLQVLLEQTEEFKGKLWQNFMQMSNGSNDEVMIFI